MFNNFNEEYGILDRSQELQDKVNLYLVNKGYNPNLKGFKYFSDIATIGLVKKKFSKTFMCEIFPFIAHKYNIKYCSVQRQLRYTFTLAEFNINKIKPDDLYQKLWFDFKMGNV